MTKFERRLCAQRIYRSYKRFICLERILKNLCTIQHTQFNYLTLPVTPFKDCLQNPELKVYLFLFARNKSLSINEFFPEEDMSVFPLEELVLVLPSCTWCVYCTARGVFSPLLIFLDIYVNYSFNFSINQQFCR